LEAARAQHVDELAVTAADVERRAGRDAAQRALDGARLDVEQIASGRAFEPLRVACGGRLDVRCLACAQVFVTASFSTALQRFVRAPGSVLEWPQASVTGPLSCPSRRPRAPRRRAICRRKNPAQPERRPYGTSASGAARSIARPYAARGV